FFLKNRRNKPTIHRPPKSAGTNGHEGRTSSQDRPVNVRSRTFLGYISFFCVLSVDFVGQTALFSQIGTGVVPLVATKKILSFSQGGFGQSRRQFAQRIIRHSNPSPMWSNYFKIALRSLTKNKSYTFINVLGLSV